MKARICEFEASGTPEDKKARAEIARLTKLLDRLAKQERFSFPVVEVKG